MIDLILGIICIFLAVLVYFTKKDSVINIEYIIVIYILGSIFYFGYYLYNRKVNRKEGFTEKDKNEDI